MTNVKGLGGGQVVSPYAYYSNNPSLIPAGNSNFLNEKTINEQREAGVGQSFRKMANVKGLTEHFYCNFSAH